MLTFWGQPSRFCDGISRRSFLSVGLGLGGLSLANILRARADNVSDAKPKHKAIIFIYLDGGPPSTDMYDLKPNAPVGVRGEFKPIQTNVPGFDVCEHLPLQAKIADQLAVVRTVQFQGQFHNAEEIITGFPISFPENGLPLREPQRPAFGSIVSRLYGPATDGMPRYVNCLATGARARYAGAAHEPFMYSTSHVDNQLKNLQLSPGVSLDRLQDRKQLLKLDTLRRDMDQRTDEGGLNPFQARSLEMIASGKVREAFDLSKEPDKIRQRYASGTMRDKVGQSWKWDNQPLLVARRLVEAGVAVVTVGASGPWDHHADIHNLLRQQLPPFDLVIHALVTDLRERGLDKDVAIVVLGEMGRTPGINHMAARDHWPRNGFALFAGGGLRMGQVIGETDAKGGYAKTRPVKCQNVLATCYHMLGIDPAQKLIDFAGQPKDLLDDTTPIEELV